MPPSNRQHNKGGGFFDKPFFRTAAALATLGGSELARAGVKVARGEKVNVGRALAAAATMGGSELAYGAGIVHERGRKPSPQVAAMVAAQNAKLGHPPGPTHLDPRPGHVFPERKHVGRAVVGLGHQPTPGRHPAPNHPPAGRPFPERRIAGRRVVHIPESV